MACGVHTAITVPGNPSAVAGRAGGGHGLARPHRKQCIRLATCALWPLGPPPHHNQFLHVHKTPHLTPCPPLTVACCAALLPTLPAGHCDLPPAAAFPKAGALLWQPAGGRAGVHRHPEAGAGGAQGGVSAGCNCQGGQRAASHASGRRGDRGGRGLAAGREEGGHPHVRGLRRSSIERAGALVGAVCTIRIAYLGGTQILHKQIFDPAASGW